MFGVDSSELLLVVLVAVVVIGPKDLPRMMRSIGHWVGKARGMASQFRLGVDQMVKDSEIADLEKKWREQNDAIMRAHPNAKPESDWGMPTPAPLPPADLTPPLGKSARPAPAPPQLAPAVEATPARAIVETPAPPAIAATPASRPAPIAPDLVRPAAPRIRPEAPDAAP